MTSHGLDFSGGLGPTVLATTWSECFAGTVLMALRIYTNAFITKRWKADFCWASITYILAILATVFLTLSVLFGLGEHVADLEAKDPGLINKNQFYQWVFTTFAIVAITLGKMAIIAFILQIEGSNTLGRRKWVLYGFAVTNLIVNIIILPIIWVQCTPTAKIWDGSIPGNCDGRLRNEMYGYFQGSFGACLDVALALYPILIFWSLKLQLHVKIGLMVLFGFGVVAAACAAVKTKQLGSLTATTDITFELARLNIWASTEMWVIFIVSCIPTIRPLFVKVFNIVVGSGSRTYASSQGYNQQTDPAKPGTHTCAYASKLGGGRNAVESNTSSLPTKGDNESEDNILPGENGIMMTSHVVVKYDDKQRAEGNREWRDGFDDSV